ncbi:hypothetical protein GCM10009846_19030 [Agrococcus versicolor]|uniref:Uncharacterized protein n=2 Tax=Agrococcus versicolor TaxID=501482 RepID=A0ABN3ASR6_9MICO
MPATPGSPLEPLRPGRPYDRRHWLLAGLLAIAGGTIVDLAARGQLIFALGGRDTGLAEILLLELGRLAVGILLVAMAYVLAPGSAVRRILGIVVLIVGIAAVVAITVALQFGELGALRSPVVRWLLNPQSLLLLVGVVGWVLASGARWWAWLAVLLPWIVGAVGYGLNVLGVEPGYAITATGAIALAIALVTLLLTIPRRR